MSVVSISPPCISMSAACLRFLTILCLPCVALSGSEEGSVVWKDLGGSITIHCRPAVPAPQDLLVLKRGLHRNDTFSMDRDNGEPSISNKLKGRLHSVAAFPNLDLIITNLTMEDMGPYWCEYTAFGNDMKTTQGNGAVLLVVKGGEKCPPENTHLFQGALLGCAALLLIMVTGFLIWIIPKTITRNQRTITNDVYEDMRGTLRR